MIESNGPSKGHFYFVDFITTWAGKRLEKNGLWVAGGYFSPLAPYPRRGSPEGRGVSKVKGIKRPKNQKKAL